VLPSFILGKFLVLLLAKFVLTYLTSYWEADLDAGAEIIPLMLFFNLSVSILVFITGFGDISFK